MRPGWALSMTQWLYAPTLKLNCPIHRASLSGHKPPHYHRYIPHGNFNVQYSYTLALLLVLHIMSCMGWTTMVKVKGHQGHRIIQPFLSKQKDGINLPMSNMCNSKLFVLILIKNSWMPVNLIPRLNMMPCFQ